MHVLIVGITGSGKTTLAQRLCMMHKRRFVKTVVLDPLRDPRWCADYVSVEQDEFLTIARKSRGCALFIDESGEMIGQYNDTMFWLATRARHYGHKSYFITQRPAQLSPTVRDQCAHLFCFGISAHDAKILAREFNKEELMSASGLSQFHYIYAPRFGSIKAGQILAA